MKFVKGLVVGSMLTAGAYMWYTDNMMGLNKKKIMKNGRKLMKKMCM